jgi:hypothetical protein
MSKTYNYLVSFTKPGTKTKLYITEVLKDGKAILSGINPREGYDFGSWGEAKAAISRIEYPYNFAYNIEKVDPDTDEIKQAIEAGKPLPESKRPVLEQEPTTKSKLVEPIESTRKPGAVAEIINLFKSGKTKAEIIAAGYNKNTVNRQISEYLKKQNK